MSEEWWHGSRYGYIKFRCRCARCKEANRVYQREYLRLRRKFKLVDEHGKRIR